MYSKPIVMIDFETTGLSPNAGDRITEVAALRILGRGVIDRFVTLVNCDVEIPTYITGLTGITQSMVSRAPPVSTVIPELLRFIGSDSLSAHNASFDQKFLHMESRRLGLAPTTYGKFICSLMLSRRLFPGLPNYKLATLSSSLGIQFKSAIHRAEADAEVGVQVLLHVGEHLRNTYGICRIEPQLLHRVNNLSAAKVPNLLKSTASGVSVA